MRNTTETIISKAIIVIILAACFCLIIKNRVTDTQVLLSIV